MNIFLVSVGGFFGSMLRFYISEQFNRKFIATWTANVTGSILLAVVFRCYMDGTISNQLWLLFGTGFCGAYTTFSTFGNETLQFLLDKKYGTAICYILSSVGVSLLVVVLILYVL